MSSLSAPYTLNPQTPTEFDRFTPVNYVKIDRDVVSGLAVGEENDLTGPRIIHGYEWSRQALEKISAAAMAEVINLFEIHPCIAMHDNIRLAYPIKHERGSHKTVTDNDTTMTVIPMNDKERAKKLLWDVNTTDQHWERIAKRYREGRAPTHQLTASHLYDLPGFQQSGQRTTSNIIQFLFQIPGLEKSPKKDHLLLAPLPPIHQLDFTRSHFYMLEPVPMEEQTYSGNYGITKEVPRQLKVDTDEKLQA